MSLSRKIGFGLATAHLTIFAIFWWHLSTSLDGQARLLWTLWIPIDFPVSLLVTAGLEGISNESPMGGVMQTWLPYVVHGGLGTIWWFFIPSVVALVYKKLFRIRQLEKTGQNTR